MPTFTVERAEKKKDIPDAKFGPAQVIALTLRNGDGTVDAEWFTKATTPLPSPGQTLEGDLEDGQYGKKFKKAQAGGGGGFGGRSPEETKRIERMAAHKTAAVILGPMEGQQPSAYLKVFHDVTNWLVADLDIGEGGGSQPAVSAPPARSSDAASLPGAELATPAQKGATSRFLNDLNVPAETQKAVVHAIAGNPPTASGLREINAAIARADYEFLFDRPGVQRPPHLPDVRGLEEVGARDEGTRL